MTNQLDPRGRGERCGRFTGRSPSPVLGSASSARCWLSSPPSPPCSPSLPSRRLPRPQRARIMARGGGARRTRSLQPRRSTSLGSGSTPRTRTAQGTDGDGACARRASERRGDPEREGPTGEGRRRGEGTSHGRVSAPSPPPPDTTLPFKGPFWNPDPHPQEEGASRAGAGGCETGTPRTDVLATSSGGGNYLRCP